MINLTDDMIREFRAIVLDFFAREGRDMPWRQTTDPYRILVSEIMLQQTQVPRVVGKYSEFIGVFPDVGSLARASLEDVLRIWQGLGYNRRALMLKRAAEEIVGRYDGCVPEDVASLKSLPGIGPYTAGAVRAFAFNCPEVIIETNIRTVYIHHFFAGCKTVRDADILPVIEATLDHREPRRWYWALMDYGAMLKATTTDPARRSAHYTRQTAFHGSDRQLRGAILRSLLHSGPVEESALLVQFSEDADRLPRVIDGMVKDGMIVREGKIIRIA